MKITDYTKEQIKEMVDAGVCGPQALRDYEMLKQIENGEKITNAAMDHNLSLRHAIRIRNKYIR